MAFRYMGGKHKQAPWVFGIMGGKNVKWKRYSEVFGGAFWVYLRSGIVSKEFHYNDYSPFLYNLWTCLNKHRDELKESLGKDKLNDKETFHGYKKLLKDIEANSKEEFVKTIPNIEVAVKYVYVLNHAFSGDFSGGMKLSCNGHQSFMSKLNDEYFIKKFDDITETHNMDCEDFIDKMDMEGGFLFVDPPYYGKENLYAFHNFTKEKHYSLADKLKTCKSLWILTYYDYDDLNDLYTEKDHIWERKEYTRSSSSAPGKGEKGVEVIVYPKRLEEKRNEKLDLFFS